MKVSKRTKKEERSWILLVLTYSGKSMESRFEITKLIKFVV